MGRFDETIRAALDTDDVKSLMVLSWLLAATPSDDAPDFDRAIEVGQRACELTDYKDGKVLDTLAAVYALAGDFASAVKWSEAAIQLLDSCSDPQVREGMLTAL